jgi:methionyl-tRNA formyltransferase
MTRRRVVVLSPGGAFTHRLLAVLAERGIALDALVLYAPGVVREWRKLRSARRRLLALPLLPFRAAGRRLRLRLDRTLRAGAPRVVYTGPLNGARMAGDLRRLEPDVLVLARCGLLGPHLLAIPREGVANVHPGLLPWIRGNSPLANSLHRGVALGGTAFWVNAGIDTGAVIERRLVPVTGAETLGQLRDGMFRLWVEMTADLVAAAAEGRLPPGTAQAGRFPICRTMPDEGGPVSAATAKALFDRWSTLCGPGGLALPAAADADFLPRAEAP